MRDKKDKDLMRQVSKLTNLTVVQVENIVETCLEFVGIVMKRGRFEGIKLPHLGTFWVKQKRIDHINHDKAESIRIHGAVRRARRKDTLIPGA